LFRRAEAAVFARTEVMAPSTAPSDTASHGEIARLPGSRNSKPAIRHAVPANPKCMARERLRMAKNNSAADASRMSPGVVGLCCASNQPLPKRSAPPHAPGQTPPGAQNSR